VSGVWGDGGPSDFRLLWERVLAPVSDPHYPRVPKGPQAMTWFAPEAESKFSIKIEGARKVITGRLFSVGVSARESPTETG